MRAIVLMPEMSDYMFNCFGVWQAASGVALHIVRRKIDAREAPFQFSSGHTGITLYEREAMSRDDILGLVQRIDPQLIICFGWADRDYLAAVLARRAGVVAVLTMDNQWRATVRQTLGIAWARLSLRRHFDFVWVPGARQRRYARLLGFSDARIRENLYVANDSHFTRIWRSLDGAPKKRLVYAGRYVAAKGLCELWQAFEAYHARHDSELELICIGTGPLDAERSRHPHVRHLGFVQPVDFGTKLAGGGIFILPSRLEPWGVVVHEFALAGFPLVLSRAVGAGDLFLGADNGFRIDAITPEAIEAAIAAVDALSEAELATMSRASRKKGEALSAADWARQADEFLAAFRG